MCAIDPQAPVKEKIKHSVVHTVWYGPTLIYVAIMVTISVALMLTGVTVG